MAKKNSTKKMNILFVIITVFILLPAVIAVALYSKNIHGTAQEITSVKAALSSTKDMQAEDFEYITVQNSELSRGDLILVNNKIKYDFTGQNELVPVFSLKNNSYKVKDKNVLLNKSIIEPLNQMLKDFEKAKKADDVLIASGYRSYAEQKEVLSAKISELGKDEAKRIAVQPGCSEHHTGYAIDFDLYSQNGFNREYNGTGKYKWLNDNAYKYGFIVRYQKEKFSVTEVENEPWHFRYVGRPHAYIITQKNFCLEEYIEYLKQFEFDKEHLLVTDSDKQEYEIYYVKAGNKKTQLPVPKNLGYTVSGNNDDGFIVTVTRT